MLLEKNKVKKR